jgi:hypothetical protein
MRSTTARVSPRGGAILRNATGELSTLLADLDTGALLGCMIIL